MSRYLIDYYLRNAISRGRMVEQFLGGFVHEGQPAIRRLSLGVSDDDDYDDEDGDGGADEGEFLRALYESVDPQHEGWWDVPSFGELPGVDQGAPAAAHRCDTIDQALALAREVYGARDDAWVNEG
ncbi:MAG TPA: hypothetical protein VFQ76_12515, partial [Longimicrobiaceae bacterium]|nr:hypothetical protein [Longimicrobiaceae bacterium]